MAETFTLDVNDGTQAELRDIAELDTCVTVVDAGVILCSTHFSVLVQTLHAVVPLQCPLTYLWLFLKSVIYLFATSYPVQQHPI